MTITFNAMMTLESNNIIVIVIKSRMVKKSVKKCTAHLRLSI